MAYQGSCHCGAVQFEVDAPVPDKAVSCNCSHCRRKGMLLAFVPAEQFMLTAGEAQLQTYKFNTHRIAHRFCQTCGTEPFAFGASPDGKPTRAINLRCVPDIDIDALELQRYDGASA